MTKKNKGEEKMKLETKRKRFLKTEWMLKFWISTLAIALQSLLLCVAAMLIVIAYMAMINLILRLP